MINGDDICSGSKEGDETDRQPEKMFFDQIRSDIKRSPPTHLSDCSLDF